MLPSFNRLNLSHLKRADLGGRKVQSEEFVLISKATGIFKLAVTVSKKVAPRAVDRNRIKRIVTESLRNQSIYNGELIVIVKKNISNLKKDEVENKLIKLIKKII